MNCLYKVKREKSKYIEYVMPKMMSSVTQITETGQTFWFMCVILYYGSISIVLDSRVGTSYTAFMIGERPITAQKFLFLFLYYSELIFLLTCIRIKRVFKKKISLKESSQECNSIIIHNVEKLFPLM